MIHGFNKCLASGVTVVSRAARPYLHMPVVVVEDQWSPAQSLVYIRTPGIESRLPADMQRPQTTAYSESKPAQIINHDHHSILKAKQAVSKTPNQQLQAGPVASFPLSEFSP